MNKVILMGRLVRDPVVRYSAGDNGTAVVLVKTLINEGYLKSADYSDKANEYVGICKNEDDILEYEYPYTGTLCGAETVVVTLDANGGYVNPKTLVYKKGSTYGILPVPVSNEYQYFEWLSENLLDYTNLSNAQKNVGIAIDSEGYVYDTSPEGDSRSWDYSAHQGWSLNLEKGSYRVILEFKTPSTIGDCRIIISTSDSTLMSSSIGNQELVTGIINVSTPTEVNIMAKSYNGVYKIRLQKNIYDSTPVSDKNHTLITQWW